MKRREPPAPRVSDALPAHLRHGWPHTREEIERWVRPYEQPPAGWDLGDPAFWRVCEANRRKRAATKKWCTDRGHSYARTVLGWRKPSPSETLAGHVTVPGE